MATRKLYSKSQKIYRPYDFSLNFEVSGGTLEQQHDADHNLFYPDRTVTPTLIQPCFRIIDRDTGTSRVATSELINISWKQITTGQPEADCNTPDFDVITTDTPEMCKGSIVVNKNVPYLTTITLKFSSRYFDTRRKRTLNVDGKVVLSTSSVASLLLYSKLDRPPTMIIDPFKLDTPQQYQEVVTPFFQLGEDKVTDLSIIGGWWYTVENDVETPVSVADDIRFDSIDPATFALTVDKRCIRDTVLRFKSALFPDKQIPAVAPPNANIDDIRFVRKYPDGMKYDVHYSGDGFIEGSSQFTLGTVTITGPNNMGVIANPDKYYTVEWSVKNAAAGTTYNVVAQGAGPVKLPMPSDEIDICCAVSEKGPLAVVVSADGKMITDDKGAAIVTQLPKM